ncbi:MAG: type II toxin-antitoxin system RelE/ParE family toxin [Methyloceanibacter sp.]
MRVRYTPRARDDLQAIIEYLSSQSLQGARNVKRSLNGTIKLIGSFPDSGRLAGEDGVRVLPLGRYPYLVYWIVEAGEAWIVHIRDGRHLPWRRA